MVTVVDVRFPAPWAVLPASPDAKPVIADLVTELTETVSAEAATIAGEYLTGVVAELDHLGLSVLATLMVTAPEDGSPTGADRATAFAVIGSASTPSGIDEAAALSAVAGQGRADVVERETTLPDLGGRTCARSVALRYAAELSDTDGVAPYLAEVRYAFAAAGGRAAFLHFETPSLVYLDDLLAVFDAIAGSVRVSP